MTNAADGMRPTGMHSYLLTILGISFMKNDESNQHEFRLIIEKLEKFEFEVSPNSIDTNVMINLQDLHITSSCG